MQKLIEWELIPFVWPQINFWRFDSDFGWLEYCLFPNVVLQDD
jgi:hypothetical protein